jgi:glycolate oxidase FAD binding subunit
MKNVAGYDLARIMAGALGTLGVLLQISVKVLPIPPCELTVVQTLDPAQAIKTMVAWAARPLPISATWHDGHDLYVRLSGGAQSVRSAAQIIGGDVLDWGNLFWQNIKEQGEAFFTEDIPLWRISVPPSTPPLDLSGKTVMEWNGALRWLKSDAAADEIRNRVTTASGHATLFRGGDRSGEVFQSLPPALMKVHKNLKKTLDPEGILNPQRMYPEL